MHDQLTLQTVPSSPRMTGAVDAVLYRMDAATRERSAFALTAGECA
jgi:hypothetical protein